MRFHSFILFILCSLFSVSQAKAQHASPQVTAVAGGSQHTAGQYRIDFTIGESVILTAGANPVCTQGFLQPLSAGEYPRLSLNLRGTAKNTYIQLAWTTTAESNNKLFYIERSANGTTFSVIDSVFSLAPGGNSSSPIQYQHADPRPLQGNNHYRLRQVSLSGGISYSETILVDFNGDDLRVRLYPNPTRDRLNVQLYTNTVSRMQFYIISIPGQVIQRKEMEIPAGYSTQNFQVSGLPAGVYIFSVYDRQSGRRINIRFIKTR